MTIEVFGKMVKIVETMEEMQFVKGKPVGGELADRYIEVGEFFGLSLKNNCKLYSLCKTYG